MKILKLIIKFVIAVLMVPIAIGVTKSFYANMILIKEVAKVLNFFLWGIVSYAILHLLFYRPTFLYVLGHEAVHAGVAWLFGGKIKSIKVSGEGGSVATDKSNVIIELSPYFIPLFTIAISVAYFVIASSYAINGSVFMFLIGFTLAFHIISTVEIMKVRQPDIVKSGAFFSIILVYTLNIVVISVLFGLLFSSFSMKKFFLDTWSVSSKIYGIVTRQLFL